MCERCEAKRNGIKDDFNPLETLSQSERLIIECSIRLARTALSRGETEERLALSLQTCMPGAAAEFVFFSALMTPDGPALATSDHPLRAIAVVNAAASQAAHR